MSAGRRFRRQAGRAGMASVLHDARRHERRLVATMPGFEVWMAGEVMFVVPAIPDGAPPELANAIERRRRASLDGRCDCGAAGGTPRRAGGVVRRAMRHEQDCPASDAGLREIVQRLGWPA